MVVLIVIKHRKCVLFNRSMIIPKTTDVRITERTVIKISCHLQCQYSLYSFLCLDVWNYPLWRAFHSSYYLSRQINYFAGTFDISWDIFWIYFLCGSWRHHSWISRNMSRVIFEGLSNLCHVGPSFWGLSNLCHVGPSKMNL